MPLFLSPSQFPRIPLPKRDEGSAPRFHWIWLGLGGVAAIAVFAFGIRSQLRSSKPAIGGPSEGETSPSARPAPEPEALSSLPDSTMPESKTSKSRNAAFTSKRSQPETEKVVPEGLRASTSHDEGTQNTDSEYSEKNPLNLNKATARQLELLPGVGPAMAEKILVTRKEKHSFKSIEDLGEVSGIGEKTMEKLRPLVMVS